jgi:copper chaperone CopZ
MKKNLKYIIGGLFIGLAIGFFLANMVINYDSDENLVPDPEEIVELMGTESTFGVKGNCGMCKKTIETAAKSLDGVLKADWDKQSKLVSLVYDSQIIDLMSIHQAIANSGYGTELVENNMDSYENLPLCCKYDPDMDIKSN